jgi:RNA polymerase sigma-70 factor (ECF subfamily)
VNPVVPDSDRVRAAQLGDQRAFTALLQESDDRMRTLAYRLLGSQAAMDDALQDAYVKAYRKIGSFNGDAAFSTWLYSIVYRTCLDHLRTRKRRSEVDLDLLDDPPVVTGGADHASQAADAAVLEAALAELPPEQAAVVLLVDGAGLTYTQAAQIMDVREGTIASRLNRAHSTLRSVLDPQEGRKP